jgi:hypothetical protein
MIKTKNRDQNQSQNAYTCRCEQGERCTCGESCACKACACGKRCRK